MIIKLSIIKFNLFLNINIEEACIILLLLFLILKYILNRTCICVRFIVSIHSSKLTYRFPSLDYLNSQSPRVWASRVSKSIHGRLKIGIYSNVNRSRIFPSFLSFYVYFHSREGVLLAVGAIISSRVCNAFEEKSMFIYTGGKYISTRYEF